MKETVVLSDSTAGNKEIKIKFKQKKTLYVGGFFLCVFVFNCMDGQTLEQVASERQGGCGVSILGYNWNLTGQDPVQRVLGGPGQSALAHPALGKGLDLTTSEVAIHLPVHHCP